jgi:mevalonate kinase
MKFFDCEKIIKIKSPSKIIITGEHFFFYSQRAILKKINHYLYLEGGAGKEVFTKTEGYICFKLDKFKIENTFSFEFVKNRYRDIIDKYLKYLTTGENFNSILQEDYDLFLAIAGFFITNYKDSIKNNLYFRIFSKKNYITSKGLGSSASFILLIIRAFDGLFSLNLKQKEIFESCFGFLFHFCYRSQENTM